jgi:hypothetical protein
MRWFRFILRKPIGLLVPVFVIWLMIFSWRYREPPSWTTCEIKTGVTFEDRGRWGSVSSHVIHVADNGTHVITMLDDDSDWDLPKHEVQNWDTRTRRRTVESLIDGARRQVEVAEGELRFNAEPAWDAFQRRFLAQRAQALDDLCKKQGPAAVEEAGWFKVGGYSRDGHYVYYGTREGKSVFNFYLLPEDEASVIDGLAIDEVTTGRRIALLPDVVKDRNGLNPWLFISPDGKTALSHSFYWQKGDHESQWLILWDLPSSRPRATIMVGEDLNWEDDRLDVYYSDDSRMVFVCIWGRATWWWDTVAVARHGHTDQGAYMTLLDGGRKFVTLGLRYYEEEADAHPDELYFWDSDSTQQLGHNYLGRRGPEHGYFRRLTSSPEGRHFALQFDYEVPDPDAIPAPPKSNWFLHWLFPAEVAPDRSRILLFDGFEQREIASLPGRQACFSHNDHWLATMDANGIVRVWELPLRKPWLRIVGLAALATMACVLGFLVVRWPFRQAGSN